VLVEGDDENEPVADTMRGLLDGHIWLSRLLGARGHYPAIDVLGSISRLMNDVTTSEHRSAAQVIRELLAVHRDHEDLLSIGAYRKGTNRRVDVAVELRDDFDRFLRQQIDDRADIAASYESLMALAEKARVKLAAPAT
jgi:flagellum-specific ATP synthase